VRNLIGAIDRIKDRASAVPDTFVRLCREHPGLNRYRQAQVELFTKGGLFGSRHNCDGPAQNRISDFVEFDPGNAIKFTLYRLRPSGSPGDPDIFGAQQYAPPLDVEVPE